MTNIYKTLEIIIKIVRHRVRVNKNGCLVLVNDSYPLKINVLLFSKKDRCINLCV